MVVHTLQCTECEETRVGRDTPDGVTPVQKACPDCGSTSYQSSAKTQSE